MNKERRRFEAKDKVKIIREDLIDKRPLSELCEQYGIAPTQFYQWLCARCSLNAKDFGRMEFFSSR